MSNSTNPSILPFTPSSTHPSNTNTSTSTNTHHNSSSTHSASPSHSTSSFIALSSPTDSTSQVPVRKTSSSTKLQSHVDLKENLLQSDSSIEVKREFNPRQSVTVLPPSSSSPSATSTSATTPSEIPLASIMSRESLKSSSQVTYSSLSAHDESEDEHGHGHGHGSSSNHGHSHSHGGKDGHGHSHSHGGGSGVEHGHSHGSKSTSPAQSRSPSQSRSPVRSPRQCGGLHRNQADSESANAKARRQLWLASICCLIFMVGEIIGGFMANSLAIMTDAAHLLSDLAGFLISIFALWVSNRAPTSRLSFGFHRAEILGALISVILIWLLTGILIYEACWRLKYPEEVDGKIMFIVAASGLGVNILMGFILHQSGHEHSHGLGGGHGHSHGGGGHGHSHGGSKKKKEKKTGYVQLDNKQADAEHHDEPHDIEHGHGINSSPDSHGHSHGSHGHEKNINVSAAFIHVLGDAIQSVGVMIAAGLIWYNPDYKIADPICTFLFSIVVLFTTTRLIRQSVAVLMEGVPEGISPDEVEENLLNINGVIDIHDLHIWSLSVGKPSLSVHILANDDSKLVLTDCTKMLAEKYNIHHSTIQVERVHDDVACNDVFKRDLI